MSKWWQQVQGGLWSDPPHRENSTMSFLIEKPGRRWRNRGVIYVVVDISDWLTSSNTQYTQELTRAPLAKLLPNSAILWEGNMPNIFISRMSLFLEQSIKRVSLTK